MTVFAQKFCARFRQIADFAIIICPIVHDDLSTFQHPVARRYSVILVGGIFQICCLK